MQLEAAVDDVLLGASLQQIAAACRARLIADFGFRPDEIGPDTFRTEVAAFMRRLARHLGDRHARDPRVGQALLEWVQQCSDYEAWDALLTNFDVDGREQLIRRGRVLFPGPLTRHWSDP